MTVWAHRSSTDAKYIYDSQKDSYQIWLDKPGTLEAGGNFDYIVFDSDEETPGEASVKLSKKPEVVEFGEGYETWSVKAYMQTQVKDESVLTEANIKSSGPIPTWRITIDVEAHDIVQALAQAYSGGSATIVRTGGY